MTLADTAAPALWLSRPGRPFRLEPRSDREPAPGTIVVRPRALGLNFIDAMPGIGYRVVLPWLRYPAVIGTDVAGEVVAIGAGVTRFAVGDRVLGHATGLERSRNDPAQGAFQLRVHLDEDMSSPLPDGMPFEQAAVLPLTLSTAATGLFQRDHLALVHPTADAARRDETVLVWGGSTAVGTNAIQLARNAGYRVIATASARNLERLRALGADAVVDRTASDAVTQLLDVIGDGPLAGTIAIGAGSLRPTIRVARRAPGTRRVTTALADPRVRIAAFRARRGGVHLTSIWGGSLKDNEVGPAIYRDFLPGALASGAYRAAPEALVVGGGLDAIPAALTRVSGAHGQKVVVTL